MMPHVLIFIVNLHIKSALAKVVQCYDYSLSKARHLMSFVLTWDFWFFNVEMLSLSWFRLQSQLVQKSMFSFPYQYQGKLIPDDRCGSDIFLSRNFCHLRRNSQSLKTKWTEELPIWFRKMWRRSRPFILHNFLKKPSKKPTPKRTYFLAKTWKVNIVYPDILCIIDKYVF